MMQAQKSYREGEGLGANEFMHAEGSVIYPLGFDDPAGLQSQQSLALLPALSVMPADSFSEALNTEIEDMSERRSTGTFLLLSLMSPSTFWTDLSMFVDDDLLTIVQ